MRAKRTTDREKCSYLYTHDLLSDLTNYHLITEQLEKELQLAKNNNQVLAIFHVTLSGFEHIHDIYGHAISDKARSITVKRFRQILGIDAHLSHLSENKYIASLVAEKDSIEIIDKTRKNIKIFTSIPINIEGFTLKAGVCIGMALYPVHGDKIDVLLDIAEKRCTN